jgi:outer membrane protein insertion porin family
MRYFSDFSRKTASVLGRIAAVVSLLLLTFAGGLRAQDFEGQTISEVVIRYRGTKTVDEQRLRDLMATRAGTAYQTERLDKDIKALNDSGLVDDIRFLAEPVGGQVRLIAEVKTRAERGGVGFLGNTVFTDKKLAQESKLKASGPLSDAEIVDARRNIEVYYQGYGYPDVLVTHRTQPTGQPGVEDLIFIIDEGVKNEVRRIRFEGNTVFTDLELRKEMKTKEKGLFSFLTKSGRIEGDNLDEDLDAVLDYYRTRGYLRASSPGIRREPVKGGRIDLVIPIYEGARYTVAGVGFGRMTVFSPEDFAPSLSLNSGDAYNSKKMRADITMMRNFYGSRGYADATITPDIRDAGPNQVTITYRVTEGSRFRVGLVNINGNVVTQQKVIRREMPLQPGDWFNSVELETTKARLDGLRYFNDVQVTASPGGAGYRDVNVLVEEGKTGNVAVGVGFSSIDNIVGFLTVEQENFSLFKPFSGEGKRWRGGGQRFASNLRLGTERMEFSVSLVEPFFMDRKLALGTELFFRESTYFSDYYEQKNAGAAVFLRRPLGDRGSLKLEYRLEEVGIDVERRTPAGSRLLQEDGDYLRSAVGLNYLYETRDDPILPRSGERVDIGLTFAGGIFGGDVDTVTLSAQGQKYWNLRWDSILSVSGELAFVDSTGDDEPPIFERMFLGGGRTLRGYEFRDVGPRDTPNTTGEVIGGKSLGYLSLEYSVPVIEIVRAAVFYDVGFVNSRSWDLSPGDLYSDIGVGLRVRLPISPLPLAVDYAIPLSTPDSEADKGGQFNFYLQAAY